MKLAGNSTVSKVLHIRGFEPEIVETPIHCGASYGIGAAHEAQVVRSLYSMYRFVCYAHVRGEKLLSRLCQNGFCEPLQPVKCKY